MLQVISPLKGFAILASDGFIGTVADFLFDDAKWKVRWLVVDCASELKAHKTLIHPSAILPTSLDKERFEVKLTKAQIEASPELGEDEPVSQQMESQLYRHYGWDPLWDGYYLGGTPGAMASPFMSMPYFGFGAGGHGFAVRGPGFAAGGDARDITPEPADGDPHLRSVSEVIGYHIHALDGEIGHVENFMVDLADWRLHYFVVDTRNWWFGKRVLISPVAVKSIDWSDRHVELDVSREKVKSSPPWDSMVTFGEIYIRDLHTHYGWPGVRA